MSPPAQRERLSGPHADVGEHAHDCPSRGAQRGSQPLDLARADRLDPWLLFESSAGAPTAPGCPGRVPARLLGRGSDCSTALARRTAWGPTPAAIRSSSQRRTIGGVISRSGYPPSAGPMCRSPRPGVALPRRALQVRADVHRPPRLGGELGERHLPASSVARSPIRCRRVTSASNSRASAFVPITRARLRPASRQRTRQAPVLVRSRLTIGASRSLSAPAHAAHRQRKPCASRPASPRSARQHRPP